MKLKFTQDAFVNDQLVFESGKIYEVSDDTGSASRWLRRGIAEVVEYPVDTKVVKADTKSEDDSKDLPKELPIEQSTSVGKIQNKSKKFPRR
jgi:hypothetical protein